VVHAEIRSPTLSASAQSEPLRVRAMEFQSGAERPFGDYAQGWIHSGEPYAALAGRYLHEFGVPREVLGLVAINNRTNAALNENAVLRTPITMDDYLGARMVRDPFGMLDMDLPVDCGEAMVITTAERAEALPRKPVYIHAASFGEADQGTEYYENVGDYGKTSPWIAMAALWAKSDLSLEDIDIFFPYDGYTINSIFFTEAAGYCRAGEAWDFFRQNWDKARNRLMVNGKTLFMTNGGSLSHGRSGGFNYYTESVRQLRGEAGARQLPGCQATLIASGSIYHDPSIAVLRTD
jgi:acetyl-CoA acetyltransferase